MNKIEEREHAIKEKIKVREEKIKNGNVKIFNWGWFKFCKCTLGIVLYTLAINLFVVPNHLYTGGILGLSQILRTFLVSTLNLNISFDISAIFYYIINIPLLLLAYKKISKTFFFRTIFTVTLDSLLLALIPIPSKPLIDDLLANTTIGGVLCGLGVGMILSTGSSSGGTDIIGIILNRKKDRISVGTIGLGFNVVVYTITGLSYGIQTMVYSIIFALFESFSLDKNHKTIPQKYYIL